MEYICTICTESLEIDREKPAFIPCGHTFHKGCITTWIKIASKCPLCNNGTSSSQIKAPLYLSSVAKHYGNSTKQSSEDLNALLAKTISKRKIEKALLHESRKTCVSLKEELQNYKTLVERLSKKAKLDKKHTEQGQLWKKKEAKLNDKIISYRLRHETDTQNVISLREKIIAVKKQRDEHKDALKVSNTKLSKAERELQVSRTQSAAILAAKARELEGCKAKMAAYEIQRAADLRAMEETQSLTKEYYRKIKQIQVAIAHQP